MTLNTTECDRTATTAVTAKTVASFKSGGSKAASLISEIRPIFKESNSEVERKLRTQSGAHPPAAVAIVIEGDYHRVSRWALETVGLSVPVWLKLINF